MAGGKAKQDTDQRKTAKGASGRERKKQGWTKEGSFRSLIQNLSEMILILDESGSISYESPSWSKTMGYPEGHFNTRLVQVIDHLLAAPEPAEPLRLVVPHVLAEYADPKLEAESAGRKVLFRMGRANAARVKAKLREIRRALVQPR